MSVVACELLNASTAEFNERNLGTYSLQFRAKTNEIMAPGDVADNCLDLPGSDNEGGAIGEVLPRLGTPYNYAGWTDATSFSRQYKIAPVGEDSFNLWLIDVLYGPLRPGETSAHANNETAPTARPPRVWLESEVYTEFLEKDNNGKAILNPAGKQYDDVLEEPAARSVLVFAVNVPTLAKVIEYTSRFQFAVNSGPVSFLGASFGSRQLLCRNVHSSQQITEGENEYYEMTFRVAVKENKPDGTAGVWDREILDRGYSHYVNAVPAGGGQAVKTLVQATDPVLDDEGKPTKQRVPVSEPVKLDADGFRVPEGGEGHFSVFQTRREVSFGQPPFVNAASGA